MGVTFFWIFLILMAFALPIFFAMLLGAMGYLVMSDQMTFFNLLLKRIYGGIDNFPIMALPFFILAGEFMNRGGITTSLVRLSEVLVGHLRGGLAHVNVLSSVFFAGLSGSAVADTSAIGSMLIPAMEKNGYDRRFAATITAASSVIGPIIPPSGLMILYAFVMKVPVAAMLLGGLVPGLLIAGGLMIVTSIIAKKRDFPISGKKATIKERAVATKDAFWPLLTPIILLGGILSGIFTPTEAAAVAVFYAFCLTVVRDRGINFERLNIVLENTAKQSASILFLVGAAVAFSAIVSLSGAAEQLAEMIISLSDNKYIILALVMVFLFFIGMFLDAGPAILILGPILQPIMVDIGIHPVHFAVLMCVNVTVGLATPPMGLVLFVASSITGEKVSSIAREIVPFILVEFAVIFLIAYVPDLILGLPRLTGLL